MSSVPLLRAVLIAAVCIPAITVANLRYAIAQSEESTSGGLGAVITPISPLPAEPAAGESAVQQMYMLRDKSGNLIHVPDFSFDEWGRFLQWRRNLRPLVPPAYTFVQPIAVSGEINDTHATLKIACKIKLTRVRSANAPVDEGASERTSTDGEGSGHGWTRIPLRFDNAIRLPQFEYDGSGLISWSHEERGEGQLVWISGPPGSEHDLSWNVLLPVISRGTQRSISLRAAAAPTVLDLIVPGNEITWTLSDPERNFVSQSEPLDQRTHVTIRGSGGAMRVSWRNRSASQSLLTADAISTVRIAGRQIESQATVTVRSRDPIDECFVRLPAESELLPSHQTAFSVELVDAERSKELGGGVIVRAAGTDGSSRQEYVIDLQTRQPLNLGGSDVASIETAGFAVVGAETDAGEIQFEVEGEWTVDWEPGPYVRQVPLAADQQAGARFLYNRQPYSLVAEIRPRRSRISVAPKYVLDVDPHRVRLNAQLDYRVQGARATSLRIDLPGWTVDSISPQEYVAATERNGDELTIQLSPAAATLDGELGLHLEMRQDYDSSRPLAVQLPKPQAESSVPAAVAVISAVNVRLSPLNEGLTGLVSDPSSADVELPERQQRPLSYRQDSASDVSIFTANVEVLQQAVSVNVHSEVLVSGQQIEVEQQLVYQIAYEPLSELVFEIPSPLAETRDWEVVEGGVELTVAPATTSVPEPGDQLQSESSDPRRFVAELREDRIGTLRLIFRYRLALPPDLLSGESETLEIGLVQPAEDVARIEQNTLRIHSSTDFEAQMSDGNWELVSDPSPSFAATGQPFYRVPGPVSHVIAAVEPAQQQTQSTTMLKKVWLQTWCTDAIRRDRVCYQILADDSFVEFVLPSQIKKLRVAVNGQEQNVKWSSGERLRVSLAGATTRESTVEIWYFLAAGRTGRSAAVQGESANQQLWGPIQTSIPRMVGVERAGRLFWQIVIPNNEHLLWPSKGLTPESSWERHGYFWRRVPNREQNRLERLVGASPQAPLPPATNRYLFSSTGPLRTVGFMTIDRSALVAGVSGVALLIGLPLILFTRLRHPAVLFGLALLLLAVAATFPEVAMVGAQASLLGLVLVLSSRLLQWTIAIRPNPRRVTATQSQYGSRPTTGGSRTEGESSSIPTAIASLPYPLPAPEPEP